jgi:hypothetical protein
VEWSEPYDITLKGGDRFYFWAISSIRRNVMPRPEDHRFNGIRIIIPHSFRSFHYQSSERWKSSKHPWHQASTFTPLGVADDSLWITSSLSQSAHLPVYLPNRLPSRCLHSITMRLLQASRYLSATWSAYLEHVFKCMSMALAPITNARRKTGSGFPSNATRSYPTFTKKR